MTDNQRSKKDNECGVDDAPIILPPALCAEAERKNCYSIVGVLVNPEKQSMIGLITQMPYIWGLEDDAIGRIIDSRKFQFVFQTEEAMNRVLRRGPWSFGDWMIVTQRWDATVVEATLKMVQYWVKIEGIPPHYLSNAVIHSIGDTVAHVLLVDFEDSSNHTDYVWVLVNCNIDNPLIFNCNYQFAVGDIHKLSFSYYGLKNFCYKCGKMTHDADECGLHAENESSNKTDEETIGDNPYSPGLDNEERGFTTAFTGTGMKVGSSGKVYVPISGIPPIDCDKLAEKCRYLKAKFVKGKSPLGTNLSPTDVFSQPGRCEQDDHYIPTNTDENQDWTPYDRTTGGYHPMEKHYPNNIFDEDYKDESVSIRGVGGSKRKRDEKIKDTPLADVFNGNKKEKCDVCDLEKQRKLQFADCKVGQVEESVISLSRVVMDSIKLEKCESVGSCAPMD